MESQDKLIFNTDRRFGVEIEINAFDGRSRHIGSDPDGIHYVGELIAKLFIEPVRIAKWGYEETNNNACWVVKPDASCGMEICSPICKGNHGLRKLCRLVDAINDDSKIKSDGRCSLHVHVDVSDCSEPEVASILAHWVKCEAVFIDSVPEHRKRNRHSQFIAMMDLFEHDEELFPSLLVEELGKTKYTTINTYHLCRGRRDTIEYRIIEAEGCRNSTLLENWIRLLIHFTDMAKNRPIPRSYRKNDRWSSLLLLDPMDVFEVLKFEADLSEDLERTRSWFVKRLVENCRDFNNLPEISFWSKKVRSVSIKQIEKLSKLY